MSKIKKIPLSDGTLKILEEMKSSIRTYNRFSKVGAVGLALFGIWMTYMTYVNQMNHADNCQYPSGFERIKYTQPTF